MIFKLVSLYLLLVSVSGCAWNEDLCASVKDMDIDEKVGEYSNLIGRSGDDAKILEDVLTIDLKCIKDACNGDDVANDVLECRANAQMTLQNQLQFVPSNYEQQLSKVCECKYNEMGESAADGTSRDSEHLTSIYGCNAAQSKMSKKCHNVPSYVQEYNVCDGNEEEKEIGREKTRESIEINRIALFCEGTVKGFVGGDGIVDMNPNAKGGCREQKKLQGELINLCDNQCYYAARYLNVMSRTLDPGFVFDDYTYTNLCEDGVKTVRGISGKGAANKMCEVCWEFLENPEQVPVQLRYPLYTASLVSEEEIKTVLSLACTEEASSYAKIRHTDLESDQCMAELKTLTGKGLGLEFGLMPDLRRKLVTKYTEKCYNIQAVPYSHCNTSDSSLDRPSFQENCESELKKMDLCADPTDLENYHWFLKFLENDSDKQIALEACEAGAKFGRHILSLPGLSTGKASIEYSRDNVNTGSKTLAFLVFHDCAVQAAMKANKYFKPEEANCNTEYGMKF